MLDPFDYIRNTKQREAYKAMSQDEFISKTDLAENTRFTMSQLNDAVRQLVLDGYTIWETNPELEYNKAKERMYSHPLLWFKARPLDSPLSAKNRVPISDTDKALEYLAEAARVEDRVAREREELHKATSSPDQREVQDDIYERSFAEIKAQGDRYSSKVYATWAEFRNLEGEVKRRIKFDPEYKGKKHLEEAGKLIGLRSVGDLLPLDLDENGDPIEQWILNFFGGTLGASFTYQTRQSSPAQVEKLLMGEDPKAESENVQALKRLEATQELALKTTREALVAAQEREMHEYYEESVETAH